MSYRIVFDRPAERGFRRLPKDVQQGFSRRLSALADNPRPTDSQKLKGTQGCYRIRQGDYRLIYTILEDCVIVLVLRVGHRGDVYRGIRDVTRAIRKRRKRPGSE